MSNNIPQKPYKPLTPFGIFVKHNFPFVEGTYEARDNYDLLCKLYQQLKTVEYNQGIAQENIEALYEFLNTLELQDEVNNKLDEMAESGELQEIMASYLNTKAIFAFDTVTDLKNATNLIDGSYAKTLGFHTINDLGGAVYKIRNITNEDVVDEKTIIGLTDTELIAELIIDKIMTPEQFGAYGDNETDDKEAIKKALLSDCNNFILNKNYYISDRITETITNKKIEGTGSIRFGADVGGNLVLNNTTIDGVNLEAPCTSNNNFATVIKGTGYTLKNLKIEGINCIFNGYQDSVRDLDIINCELKGFYRDISLRGSIKNINIIDCDFSRDYLHTTPVIPDHHVYIYSNTLESNVVNADFIAQRGNSLTIKNCKFNRCAQGHRDLIIINMENITIDQIITNNGTLVNNGTDDIITIDLCKNVNISNVNIDWSGENGIDLLTCENVKVSNCNIRNCDYCAVGIDHSDVGSTFGFVGVDSNCKNILVTGCYLESTRAAATMITTAYGVEISNCTLSNIYQRGSSTFYGKIVQIAHNSSGGKIKKLKIVNNHYIYDLNNIQIWAYPGTTEQLAVFDSWDSKMEVDEEIGRVFTLTNPTISSGGNVLNVNLPLRRMKAYLLNTSDNKYYDITGLNMIKRPNQTDNDVISRGGCYLAGINQSGTAINVNISFGDYISNTPINNSNPYSAPYGATTGTVKIVMY